MALGSQLRGVVDAFSELVAQHVRLDPTGDPTQDVGLPVLGAQDEIAAVQSRIVEQQTRRRETAQELLSGGVFIAAHRPDPDIQ